MSGTFSLQIEWGFNGIKKEMEQAGNVDDVEWRDLEMQGMNRWNSSFRTGDK